MLGELSYEGMLEPTLDGDGWLLSLPAGSTTGSGPGAVRSSPGTSSRAVRPGTASRRPIRGCWSSTPGNGWGSPGCGSPTCCAELTATVTNEAIRLDRAPTAAELSTMDYDRADGYLTGHPRLVLNKGRVGFSAADRERYAPESGSPSSACRWYGVHRDHASFRCVAELSEERLLAEELGDQLPELRSALSDPDDYVLVPVHPWQADEILGTLYAAELARGIVVPLGESVDRYRPHQTIRTLANASHPTRRDVKTAVSVRNTLVYRGLDSGRDARRARRSPPGCARSAPRTRCSARSTGSSCSARWRACRCATRCSADLAELPYRFHETLGALWREPVRTRLGPGERAHLVRRAALPGPGRRGRAGAGWSASPVWTATSGSAGCSTCC